MSPSHAWLSHFIVEEVVLPSDGEFSPPKVACSILGQLLLLEWVGFVLFKPKNVFAWRILWTEEPGRLQSIGLHRVGHNWKLLSMHTSKNVFISVSPCCSSPLGLKPALGDSKGTLWGFEGAGSGKSGLSRETDKLSISGEEVQPSRGDTEFRAGRKEGATVYGPL